MCTAVVLKNVVFQSPPLVSPFFSSAVIFTNVILRCQDKYF